MTRIISYGTKIHNRPQNTILEKNIRQTIWVVNYVLMIPTSRVKNNWVRIENPTKT